MFKAAVALLPLSLFLSPFAAHAENPSPELKRQVIEEKKDQSTEEKIKVQVEAGRGQTYGHKEPYNYTGVSGSVKTRQYKVGDFASITDNRAAITPELKINVRLDENGKALRFETEGKLIALFAEKTVTKTETAFGQKQEKGGQPSGMITTSTLEGKGFDLGFQYKNFKDVLYKVAGLKGTVFNFNFDMDVQLKNSPLGFGVCGILDLLQFEMGQYTVEGKSGTSSGIGISGSLCARANIGPVVLSHNTTVDATSVIGTDRSRVLINNSSRLSYTSEKLIPGTTTEVGFGYTHSRENIGSQKIQSNYVGGGVTVSVK